MQTDAGSVTVNVLPLPIDALHVNLAAHGFDETLGDRKAQARAFAATWVTQLPELVEDARLVFRADADAGIADGDENRSVFRRARFCSERRRNR